MMGALLGSVTFTEVADGKYLLTATVTDSEDGSVTREQWLTREFPTDNPLEPAYYLSSARPDGGGLGGPVDAAIDSQAIGFAIGDIIMALWDDLYP